MATIDHRIVIGDRNIISSAVAYDPNVPYDPQLDWDNFGIDNYNVIMSSFQYFCDWKVGPAISQQDYQLYQKSEITMIIGVIGSRFNIDGFRISYRG